MHLVYGNLWDEVGKANLILVTANSTLTQDGRLVMGAGAAKEARNRFPGLDVVLGKKVGISGSVYGVLVGVAASWYTVVGAFQVKRHWRDPADMELIRHSTERLLAMLRHEVDCHVIRYQRIAMNFPGIGCGRLDEEKVLPIISALPDVVYVYRREQER